MNGIAKEDIEERGVGRPTDYKKEYIEQAFKFCKLGATMEELADLLNESKDNFFYDYEKYE